MRYVYRALPLFVLILKLFNSRQWLWWFDWKQCCLLSVCRCPSLPCFAGSLTISKIFQVLCNSSETLSHGQVVWQRQIRKQERIFLSSSVFLLFLCDLFGLSFWALWLRSFPSTNWNSESGKQRIKTMHFIQLSWNHQLIYLEKFVLSVLSLQFSTYICTVTWHSIWVQDANRMKKVGEKMRDFKIL